jgi:HEAT repeat protein
MRRLIVSGLAVALGWVTALLAQTPAEDVALLRAAGVPTEAAGLVAWVQQLQPSDRLRAQAEALVRQLGDDDFERREQAATALVRLGPVVLGVLQKALSSPDAEVRKRSHECLRRLPPAPSEKLVAAAAQQLAALHTPEATVALLDLLASVSEELPSLVERLEITGERDQLAAQITQALLNSLRRSEQVRSAVRTALRDAQAGRRCAAAVVLVLSSSQETPEDVRRLLRDPHRGVRLGVAEALLRERDRSAIPVLISLTDQADEYAEQASSLLESLVGDQSFPRATEHTAEARARRQKDWEAWWQKNAERPDLLNDLLTGRNEKFDTPAADVTKGYHSFQYEATAPDWKAEVRDGKLVLHGDHDEGDQRLYITARKVTGYPRWPAHLHISTKLGGTDQAAGAWHVGVLVGRVKVLFHPGFSGGAFRVELLDTHQQIVGNDDMRFTPAPGLTHPMTILVRRQGQGYRFDVAVGNAAAKGGYRKSFEVTAEQLGRYDRLGLERSGRRGGDALFESVLIKAGK